MHERTKAVSEETIMDLNLKERDPVMNYNWFSYIITLSGACHQRHDMNGIMYHLPYNTPFCEIQKKDTELQSRPGSSQLTLSPARTPAPSQPAGWSANLSTAPHSHRHLVQTMVASVPLAPRVRLLPWSRMMGWWRLSRFGRPWLNLEVLFCCLNLQKCFEFSFLTLTSLCLHFS